MTVGKRMYIDPPRPSARLIGIGQSIQFGASMTIPPVFSIDDVTSSVIDDLRDASATYCGPDYYYMTSKFDELIMLSERAATITGFFAGSTAPIFLAEKMREWLLKPWRSARSLSNGRMQALGQALGNIRATVAEIPGKLPLENADVTLLAKMVEVFKQLDDCAGIGATIASKILAPLRPALFPIWDNPIADAYGFAQNAAGYHQYLTITQAIARKIRGFWHSEVPLEQYLKPERRLWVAPLAKVIDEWNWIRITQKHPFLRIS
jgi:hypothetical protein